MADASLDGAPNMFDATPNPQHQRAFGRAHLEFVAGKTASRLVDLHQSGCTKVILPRNHQPRTDAVFINTAGGITGGDRLRYSADVGDDADLCLTTQTAERIYKSSGGAGTVENTFTLGANAVLDWMPQETILFEGSALNRTLTVEMDKTAAFLALEPLVLGRKAMGETLHRCAFTDTWRIHRGGQLAYADALRIMDPTSLAGTATFGENRAIATMVYVAPDAEARLESLRQTLSFNDVTSAASAWNGCLVARFAAPDAQPLRKALIATLTQFRPYPMPRVWHM